MGVWQHEGGWLQQVLLSSQPVGGVSSQGHTPHLMLVHYNSQYYLQSAIASHPDKPHPLQLDTSRGEVPKTTPEPCFGDLGQMREVYLILYEYNKIWLAESSYFDSLVLHTSSNETF